MEEDRKATLLRAAYDLLKKQDDAGYVMEILSETVFYDGADGDGHCLLDDIAMELEIDE